MRLNCTNQTEITGQAVTVIEQLLLSVALFHNKIKCFFGYFEQV